MPDTRSAQEFVGRPYHPGRSRWPEFGEYLYRGGHHQLLLFWRHPTDTETAAVQNGDAHLALSLDGPVIWFLYRFEGGPDWRDAVFTWHALPESERTLPPDQDVSESVPLEVVLVDAEGGEVRAARQVPLESSFASALHSAIRAQAARPWDPRAFRHRHQRARVRFRTAAAMAEASRARM